MSKMPPPRDISPQFLSPEGFHPEFGYLCPTRRMRLKIRMIAILASIGMMLAAISVLALMHRELAAAPVAGDEASALLLPRPAAPASCRDLRGMFLHRQCQSGKSRAARSRRGVSRQMLSLPIGRRGVVSANESAVVVANVAMSGDETTPGRVTDNVKAPSVRLGDSAGSGKKGATKIARKYKATPQGENGLNAFAAASRLDRYARSPEATPIRSRDWSVNRRPNLAPDRRPISAPSGDGFWR
jgi:hypothetical protein